MGEYPVEIECAMEKCDGNDQIIYVPESFDFEIEILQTFASEVTGSHILILDRDEYYTEKDLQNLYEDIKIHPEVDLFVFDTYDYSSENILAESLDPMQRRTISIDILQQRIYKWISGTRFDDRMNIPVYPNGQEVRFNNYSLNTMFTRVRPSRHVENELSTKPQCRVGSLER